MVPDLQTSQQATELLGEALKGLPVLAVMWYMLKDVRTAVKVITDKISALELKIAADDNRLRIDHLNDNLKESRVESRDQSNELRERIRIMENQFPKIWAKIGDRPEDQQSYRSK